MILLHASTALGAEDIVIGDFSGRSYAPWTTTVRAKGQALGSATHWTMAAAIGWTFPALAAWSGAGAFAFFAAMMVVQLVFAIKLMPETRGRRLEEANQQSLDGAPVGR